MLQDLNVNPVQPSISATNLNIVQRPGWPLKRRGLTNSPRYFEQNQYPADSMQHNASGNNDTTAGAEAVMIDSYMTAYSISLAAAFDYRNGRFPGPNNDTSHHNIGPICLVNAAVIADDVNLQARRSAGERPTYGDIVHAF